MNFKILIMSIIAAGITAAGGLLGSAFNFGSQRNTNKANMELAREQNEYNLQLQQNEFQQNRMMSDIEWERNLKKWTMENEYNSPVQQMARYQQAGLNPNLIYGSGSASAGNAGSIAPYSAPRYSAPRAERATLQAPRVEFDPYQAMSFAQQLSIQKAQKSQLDAQTDFVKQQTKNESVNNLIKVEDLLGRKLSNREKEALFESNVMYGAARARNEVDNNQIIRLNARQLQYKYEHLNPLQRDRLAQELRNLKVTNDIDSFRHKLQKIGIGDHDTLWTRVAARLIMSLSPKTVDDVAEGVKEGVKFPFRNILFDMGKASLYKGFFDGVKEGVFEPR